MKKLIDIWCEADLSRDLYACHLGTAKGETLQEACDSLAKENPYFGMYLEREPVLAYKGCKIYDNEEAARIKEDLFFAQ